jgi:hypothetical protein
MLAALSISFISDSDNFQSHVFFSFGISRDKTLLCLEKYSLLSYFAIKVFGLESGLWQ